ncbi:DUF5685 family protein [Streptomyces reniochalinae]|uniref:Cysteine-rich transmembrane CYSTM domain-containing protein n=1 Tax=Streptomyces reniochalinae TaxID=2250578 RepID=A0A367EG10_9ACTN|nr:DUF5685 family protein [Streptomyces reniochalinae]RCG16689.1 hypothetical protein DQ392_21550 [Streptomyces reniochalinae]
MFGIVRPCQHRLSAGLRAEWMAHLCGLCLALRGDHGQFARVVTNYDGLLVSVLTDAQTGRVGAARRTAGPCPLRGMRTASVAQGEGARLAASVSLVLASAKVRDHIADRNGMMRRRPVAAAARRIAAGWDRAGARAGGTLGFDTAVLVDAVDRQTGIEHATGPGTPLTTVTEPTETATAAAFAHTATLAGKPGNAAPLAEAGRLFGRLAHLLDAVEDRFQDAAEGAWNPLTATGATVAEARRLCDDAVHGIRLALRDVDFADAKLAHVLLVHELPRAVDRAFGTTRCAHPGPGPAPGPYDGSGDPYHRNPYGPGPHGPHGQNPYNQNPYAQNPYGANPYGQAPYGQTPQGPGGRRHGGGEVPPGDGWGGGGGGGGWGGGPDGSGAPGGHQGGKPPRGFWAGCAAFIGLCCTCKLCCADEYEGPWSRKKRAGCCEKCECCECCECCSCCDCGL